MGKKCPKNQAAKRGVSYHIHSKRATGYMPQFIKPFIQAEEIIGGVISEYILKIGWLNGRRGFKSEKKSHFWLLEYSHSNPSSAKL